MTVVCSSCAIALTRSTSVLIRLGAIVSPRRVSIVKGMLLVGSVVSVGNVAFETSVVITVSVIRMPYPLATPT